jgi:NAD(P)-dependent dehydrogenase (short-subunit alcohol dehydrogenase family)
MVTGANRGTGKHFVDQLLRGGVHEVYATARSVDAIDVSDARAIPLRLDLLNEASIMEAAVAAPEVNLLINSAGITTGADHLISPMEEMRAELEAYLFGTLRVIRALTPVIETRGAGAIVNVLSVLSWVVTAAGSGSH